MTAEPETAAFARVQPPPALEESQLRSATPPPRALTLPDARQVAAALMRNPRVTGGIIAAVTLIVVGVAWALAATRAPRYRASVLVAVIPAAGIDADQVFRGVEVLQYRTVVATLAALASTPAVLHDLSPETSTGAYAVNAVVLPHADLLRVEVEGSDARTAAAMANRMPALLSARARSLYRFYAVDVVTPAEAPAEPFSPNVPRAIASGAIAGLIAGLGIAIVVQLRRTARAT